MLRYKTLIFFVSLSGLTSQSYAEPLKVSVQAESAILYNPETGRILYEKEAFKEHYPASITKIATALWALKLKGINLNQMVEASQESLASMSEEAKKKVNYNVSPWLLVPGATNMGLKKGEVLPFKDLLYGLMLVSAGDSANVIAEYAGGNIPQFMKGMNLYLKKIGCQSSHFENPSGLFHPDQKTCAYDMALIMAEALKDPVFKEIIGTVNYTRSKTNKQASSTLIQNNRLLRQGPYQYSKAIGGKTGYLASALNTFVAAAKEGERTLIVVLLKVKERTDIWKDSIQLFDAAFNQPKIAKIYINQGLQKAILEDETFEEPLTAFLEEDLRLEFYPAEEPSIKALVYWDAIQAPVFKGQKVGEIQLVDETNTLHKKAPIFAANTVKATWAHTLYLFFMTGSFALLALKWALSIATILGLCYLALPKSR